VYPRPLPAVRAQVAGHHQPGRNRAVFFAPAGGLAAHGPCGLRGGAPGPHDGAERWTSPPVCAIIDGYGDAGHGPAAGIDDAVLRGAAYAGTGLSAAPGRLRALRGAGRVVVQRRGRRARVRALPRRGRDQTGPRVIGSDALHGPGRAGAAGRSAAVPAGFANAGGRAAQILRGPHRPLAAFHGFPAVFGRGGNAGGCAANLQEMIFALERYWADRGCIILQPYDMEVGAGPLHPAAFLGVLGPEPWKRAYVQPSRRPTDGRYGESPNRLQHYYQYQVSLIPSPDDIPQLHLASLPAIGIDPAKHDIRF